VTHVVILTGRFVSDVPSVSFAVTFRIFTCAGNGGGTLITNSVVVGWVGVGGASGLRVSSIHTGVILSTQVARYTIEAGRTVSFASVIHTGGGTGGGTSFRSDIVVLLGGAVSLSVETIVASVPCCTFITLHEIFVPCVTVTTRIFTFGLCDVGACFRVFISHMAGESTFLVIGEESIITDIIVLAGRYVSDSPSVWFHHTT
jgi:hypothetical protein